MIWNLKNKITSKTLLWMAAPLALFVGCSSEHQLPEGLLFSGACKVEVQAKPKGAQILLDGVVVGVNSAEVEIPCGEKQIIVKSKGYVPHLSYQEVTEGSVLTVNVELAKIDKSAKSFALSQEIIEQVKDGLPLWDPAKGPRPEVKQEEGVYPSYMGDMKTLLASVQGVKSAADSGSASEEFEVGTWDSVEDWR